MVALTKTYTQQRFAMQTRFNTENLVLTLAYGLISIIRNLRSPKEYIYSLAKPVAFAYTTGYETGIRFRRIKSTIQRRFT